MKARGRVSTALLTLLVGEDSSEEWKDERDAAIISWSQQEEDTWLLII